MSTNSIFSKMKTATEAIQARAPGFHPEVGVILGSGYAGLMNSSFFQDEVTIPYSEIPHFHGISVEGHAGSMKLGKFAGTNVVLLNGRFHLYEGYPMDDVVLPTRVLCSLGIHTLIITNAVGAIHPKYRPGDLMIIEDHINLMGDNPLRGGHLKELGPQYPDMSEAYSDECQRILEKSAIQSDIHLHKGVYAGMLGPTFETPAEVRMLRAFGADVVGMSTVHEAIAAHHLGVRVSGICSVTNLAAGLSKKPVSRQEIVENSRQNLKRVEAILSQAIPMMNGKNPLAVEKAESFAAPGASL